MKELNAALAEISGQKLLVTIFYNQENAGNIQFTFLRHYNRS